MIYVDNGGAELVRQLLRTGEPFCVIEYGKHVEVYAEPRAACC